MTPPTLVITLRRDGWGWHPLPRDSCPLLRGCSHMSNRGHQLVYHYACPCGSGTRAGWDLHFMQVRYIGPMLGVALDLLHGIRANNAFNNWVGSYAMTVWWCLMFHLCRSHCNETYPFNFSYTDWHGHLALLSIILRLKQRQFIYGTTMSPWNHPIDKQMLAYRHMFDEGCLVPSFKDAQSTHAEDT